MNKLNQRIAAVSTGLVLCVGAQHLRADEQLFGFTRGAETLPKGHFDLYQFTTFRTGKDSGSYYACDFETELEYGFTDQFQASVALEQHYFDYHGVDGLDNMNAGKFGGVVTSAKYRIWSPFKDPVGIAARLEGGYLVNDEVGGLPENELFIAPELDLQKNFRDDTIICDLNLGPEFAWGKRPAEQYDHELALQAATGIAYRFAPNWFIGPECNIRAEFPNFDLNNFEHAVLYAGPSIHYSAERWWTTLTVAYQAWGNGVDEPNNGKTYAEETDWKIRWKVGFNF